MKRLVTICLVILSSCDCRLPEIKAIEAGEPVVHAYYERNVQDAVRGGKYKLTGKIGDLYVIERIDK